MGSGLVARDCWSVLFLHMVLSLFVCTFSLSKRMERENEEKREGGKKDGR